MGVRPPGFVNPLKAPGDLISVDANGNIVAISAAGLAGLAIPYAAGTTYGAGALVTGSDDNVYVSLAGGNSGHDPTTDAGVHWHQARSTIVSSTVAPVGPIADTEAVIVHVPLLPLKTLRVGSKVRITIQGTCTSTNPDVPTFNVRAGTVGDETDALVATIGLPVSVIGGPTPFKVVIEFTVETLGATGTCSGSLEVVNGGVTGLSLAPVQVIAFTSATLATDTATFLDASFVAAAATTSITVADASIEIP